MEHVKHISLILPRLFSGISGDPRVSVLIIQRAPPPTAAFQLEGPATRGRSGLTQDDDPQASMLFCRQVLCLEVLAEEEGLVEVWPVG